MILCHVRFNALWYNWLLRLILVQESPGSSPGGASKQGKRPSISFTLEGEDLVYIAHLLR